jgi:transaldolase
VLEDASHSDSPPEHAEHLLRAVVRNAAKMFEHEYERSEGDNGYVCAQVDPSKAGDREAMARMAERFHAWAPNIAVKLPATAAGLDVLEDCCAQGITVTATVSFSLPQVIAVAERYTRACERAGHTGNKPGRCFAVIMIGRLDDYVRDVVKDAGMDKDISESDIIQAGLAVTKRAYSVFKERGYRARLIIAALRGTYHMEELAGAELIMSIHPKYQAMLLKPDISRDPERIHDPVAQDVIGRLKDVPEFVRAFEPDGMGPEEFIGFGPVQRTLSQFYEKGWSQLETM